MAENKTPLLSIKDLVIEFSTENGVVRATDRISFDVYPNETVGIVGESGCGKTVTGLSILGLIPSPPGRIESGSIKMLGRELVGLTESELREIRGRDISMIFQEPMTALNPVFTVGNQMCDVLMRHRGLTRRQARDGAIEMLAKVGIPVPAQRIDEYPHQLSGGMRQRVMIAMALSCGPKLQREFHMAVVLITHDLGVVAETCDRAIVMYCGRIVESAPIDHLFATPRHPYTKGLLESIPRIRADRLAELPIIPGRVPDLLHLPPGCRFADRCPRADSQCTEQQATLSPVGSSSDLVACHHPHSIEQAEHSS